jgi:kynureninase
LVQYYTAQLFDIEPLAAKAHEIGALIGLDLAHGSGNVDCKLDDWNVDFAVWCTYKWVSPALFIIWPCAELTRYLNSGPAGIGGMFVKRGLDPKDRRHVVSCFLFPTGRKC